MRAAPVLVHDTLLIRPWPDPVIDTVGVDPRSEYVERFWLSILGPSTTWLLRRLATGLEQEPAGFELPLAATADELGLGHKGGRNSPFVRALGRLCTFGMAQAQTDNALAVRRKVPPLNRRQVEHLPVTLHDAHRSWQERMLAERSPEQLRQRARQLALSLADLGEPVEAVERQLARWRFHPAIGREAAVWATAEHERRAADGA